MSGALLPLLLLHPQDLSCALLSLTCSLMTLWSEKRNGASHRVCHWSACLRRGPPPGDISGWTLPQNNCRPKNNHFCRTWFWTCCPSRGQTEATSFRSTQFERYGGQRQDQEPGVRKPSSQPGHLRAWLQGYLSEYVGRAQPLLLISSWSPEVASSRVHHPCSQCCLLLTRPGIECRPRPQTQTQAAGCVSDRASDPPVGDNSNVSL